MDGIGWNVFRKLHTKEVSVKKLAWLFVLLPLLFGCGDGADKVYGTWTMNGMAYAQFRKDNTCQIVIFDCKIKSIKHVSEGNYEVTLEKGNQAVPEKLMVKLMGEKQNKLMLTMSGFPVVLDRAD